MLPFSRFNRYFQEVASQGSLRRAAEVLHVSASAIDRQIIQAERALDIKLFERLPSGLKLTAAGELMLNDVGRWRKEYARTVERLDELRGLRRGHVGIALGRCAERGRHSPDHHADRQGISPSDLRLSLRCCTTGRSAIRLPLRRSMWACCSSRLRISRLISVSPLIFRWAWRCRSTIPCVQKIGSR